MACLFACMQLDAGEQCGRVHATIDAIRWLRFKQRENSCLHNGLGRVSGSVKLPNIFLFYLKVQNSLMADTPRDRCSLEVLASAITFQNPENPILLRVKKCVFGGWQSQATVLDPVGWLHAYRAVYDASQLSNRLMCCSYVQYRLWLRRYIIRDRDQRIGRHPILYYRFM